MLKKSENLLYLSENCRIWAIISKESSPTFQSIFIPGDNLIHSLSHSPVFMGDLNWNLLKFNIQPIFSHQDSNTKNSFFILNSDLVRAQILNFTPTDESCSRSLKIWNELFVFKCMLIFWLKKRKIKSLSSKKKKKKIRIGSNGWHLFKTLLAYFEKKLTWNSFNWLEAPHI